MNSKHRETIEGLTDYQLNKSLLIELGWEMRKTNLNSKGEQLFQLYTPDGKAYPPQQPYPWPESVHPEALWQNICNRYPYARSLSLAYELWDGEKIYGNLFGKAPDAMMTGIHPSKRHLATAYAVDRNLVGFAMAATPSRAICESVLQILWSEKDKAIESNASEAPVNVAQG